MAALLPEPNENLVEHAIEAPVAAVHCAGVKVGVQTVIVPKTGLVIAEQTSITWQAVGLICNLADCEQRSIHRKIRAVMIIAANGWVPVIDATHDVGPRGRSYFDKSNSGIIGIDAHTGGVEENAYRIPIEAILYENIVVGRDQEVVARADAAKSEFDAIVEKFLQVSYVDEVESFATENLLNSENVMDVVCRQVAAETI